MQVTDLNTANGSSICCSKVNQVAATLEGSIQYTWTFTSRSVLCFIICWNVVNDQLKTGKLCNYCWKTMLKVNKISFAAILGGSTSNEIDWLHKQKKARCSFYFAVSGSSRTHQILSIKLNILVLTLNWLVLGVDEVILLPAEFTRSVTSKDNVRLSPLALLDGMACCDGHIGLTVKSRCIFA